jgi:hypothetical protein
MAKRRESEARNHTMLLSCNHLVASERLALCFYYAANKHFSLLAPMNGFAGSRMLKEMNYLGSLFRMMQRLLAGCFIAYI